MTNIKWWIRPGDHMLGYSHDQQLQSIKLAWAEIESVCDIKFQQVSKESKARIEFRCVENLGALGKAGRHGRIRISSDRDLKLTGVWNLKDPNIKNRYAISVVAHEFHHTFGGNHVHDFRQCYMHPWLGYWMCPTEALQLQKKYGKPKNTFYPIFRQYITQQIVAAQDDLDILKDFRQQFLHERSTLPTKPQRVEAHRKVLLNLKEQSKVRKIISDRSKEWHDVNNSWKGVAKVG